MVLRSHAKNYNGINKFNEGLEQKVEKFEIQYNWGIIME